MEGNTACLAPEIDRAAPPSRYLGTYIYDYARPGGSIFVDQRAAVKKEDKLTGSSPFAGGG